MKVATKIEDDYPNGVKEMWCFEIGNMERVNENG